MDKARTGDAGQLGDPILLGVPGLVNGMVAPSQTGIQCAKVGR